MNILISNSSGQPIYEQIFVQIKNLILKGDLSEGDSLPSMRVLAKELRISVITTKRAYEELERNGLIVSLTGKGSFITGTNIDLIKEENLKNIEISIQDIVDNAKTYDLSLNELIDMLTTIYNEF